MNMTETLIDGDPERYEQRFSVAFAGSGLSFVRRPVSIEPPDGTVCVVDEGPRCGRIGKRTGAKWKDGRWLWVKFEPTHWTDLDLSRRDG